jgi:hypothetical protein
MGLQRDRKSERGMQRPGLRESRNRRKMVEEKGREEEREAKIYKRERVRWMREKGDGGN